MCFRLTRSIRSNGYASSQVSYSSQRPMTPRTPTGLSSPGFNYTDASRPIYDDISRRYACTHVEIKNLTIPHCFSRLSSSTSPFQSSSRAQLTSASQGNLYVSSYGGYQDEVSPVGINNNMCSFSSITPNFLISSSPGLPVSSTRRV